jgi:hypothetical protein
MKRMLLIAAGLVASIAIVACTAQQQQTLSSLAALAKSDVQAACNIVQPALNDLKLSLPGDDSVADLADDNAQLCAAIATLDPTSVKSIINTAIPDMLELVDLLPIDQGTANLIKVALGAASIALNNWLVMNAAATTTAAASGVPAVSAPAAASTPLVGAPI